jgi:hypothetical protein
MTYGRVLPCNLSSSYRAIYNAQTTDAKISKTSHVSHSIRVVWTGAVTSCSPIFSSRKTPPTTSPTCDDMHTRLIELCIRHETKET